MKYELHHTEFFKVMCPDGKTAMGGSQKWYPLRWQRAAGCGPTSAANLMWYMARSHPELRNLVVTGDGDYEYTHFLDLMREVFSCFTPGIRGINSSALFIDGVKRYASARGIDLIPHALEVPASRRKRPDIGTVGDFITAALLQESPVAFLNLSRGKLKTLESWHWVTIMGCNRDSGDNGDNGDNGDRGDRLDNGDRRDVSSASILNYGFGVEVSIAGWLETSTLGGCFVYFT